MSLIQSDEDPGLRGESLFERPIVKQERTVDIRSHLSKLPESVEPYTDIYFLRTRDILDTYGLNPIVRAQVFIRKGPGVVKGLDEAITLIDQRSDFFKNGGKAYALEEGDRYEGKETLLVLEGRIHDLVHLETTYLGILSRATTAENGGPRHVDLKSVEEKMKAVVQAAEEKPVTYFGARHWHWKEDAAIAAAAKRGGAKGASTDAGAEVFGLRGSGTIPHALENIFAYAYGKDRAVVEATKAFDQVMDPSIPRIALIDYNNKEIDDSISTARELRERLYAVRVDTCGENVAQGALSTFEGPEADAWRSKGLPLISKNHPDAKYWVGTGVTVTGVVALRLALNEAGFHHVKIILTSGFGKAEKVEAFKRAEKLFGETLFDGLGVGELFETRSATMDIVGIQTDDGSWIKLNKVGREYSPNDRLQEVVIKR